MCHCKANSSEFKPKLNFHVSTVSDPILNLDLIISSFNSHCHMLPPDKLNRLHPLQQREAMLSLVIAARHFWITSYISQLFQQNEL